MAGLTASWIGGAIPIFIIAWLLRKIFRQNTKLSSIIITTIIAMLFGWLMTGFGEGEGGFYTRLQNMVNFDRLILISIPSGLIALVVAMISAWRSIKTSGDQQR